MHKQTAASEPGRPGTLTMNSFINRLFPGPGHNARHTQRHQQNAFALVCPRRSFLFHSIYRVAIDAINPSGTLAMKRMETLASSLA